MADQTQRLEIATVRAEVGSNIVYRFSNDAAEAAPIPTDSGDIQNLKQVVLEIQAEAADKISIATTIYPTVAAGLAATPDQSIFLVQSNDADGIYTVWKNESGTAVNTGKTALSATAIQTALDASNEAAQAAENAADVAIERTARYLAPSATPPTVRDDGLPLEIGDIWFNTVDQTEYRYTDDGWQPNDSLLAIVELRGEISEEPMAQGIPRANISGKINPDWLGGFFYDYSELRAYQGNFGRIVVTKPGLYGEFRSLGVIPGFVDTDGTYIVTETGVVYERIHDGRINVHWFNCPLDGVTLCDDAFAKWTSLLKSGRALIPAGKYNLSTATFKLIGHSPVEGSVDIEATGAEITGECKLVVDSCKRLRITGLEGLRMDLHLNGAWFFNTLDLKFRRLVLGSSPGTVFSDNYWNKFSGGQIQNVLDHPNAVGPSNKFIFNGTCWRGRADQGFASAFDYAIEFMSAKNCQSWSLDGVDMSYYTVSLLYADPTKNKDIELTFNEPYFDSLYPALKGFPKARIVVNEAHAANAHPNSISISQVTRGSQDAWRSDRASGWKSHSGRNLIPNGDFSDVLISYEGANLPIGALNGAVLTKKSGDGMSGNYLNLNQAAITNNSVRFRQKACPMDGRYTYTAVVRNANVGQKTIRVAMGGLFFDASLTDTEWTLLNMTTGVDLAKGSVNDIQLFTNDNTAFNIDVCFVSCTLGESTPLFQNSPKRATIDAGYQEGGVNVPWEPPSVAIGASTTVDIVVPEATLGDFVSISFGSPLQGQILSAYVHAAGTVRVVLFNCTAAAINMGAATLRVRVHKLAY